MSAKKSALGRSFASLIPTEVLDEEFDPTAAQDEKVSDLRHIKLTDLVPDPDQPRKAFDDLALEALAESIRVHGVLQPIVVTPQGDKYLIVAGERRYRAALRTDLAKIPALVRTLSNQHKLELSLIENLQRQNLNIIETATGYLKLRDQFNLTLEQIGERVGGKSIAAISNTLRLLRLPESVRLLLARGELSEGQARPLINVDPAIVEKIAPRVRDEEWSARAVEQWVSDMRKNAMEQRPKADPTTTIKVRYEQESLEFTKHFKTKVQVKTNTRGAGQIMISFKDDKDFQRISKLFR